MRGGIETLPLSILREILSCQLGAVDLAHLESSSSMFRAPSGIAPCESKSIAEAAAHHSCQTHPVFKNLPPHARLGILTSCDGQWKQVLYFLECLLHMPGRSVPASACNNVVATAGGYNTLIVNGNGKLYITSGGDRLSTVYHDITPEPQSTLRLIFTQPTTNRILQISANFWHVAFVTETGQVFTFGYNKYCGVGLESDHVILKPTLVTALETTPCQQVMTGDNFTIALMRSGKLYSWGMNNFGQLGHGHTCNEFRPREVIVQGDNGAPDPVVQVSTTRWHVAAVTKSGRLFTWGSNNFGCLGHSRNNWGMELQPKRVEHGGFAELFIVCAAAGCMSSAATDSSGLVVVGFLGHVYTWGANNQAHSCTPLLIESLKAYRAVQVVAYWKTFVVLDNGQVHYFKNGKLRSSNHCDKKRSGSFTIEGHKIQSITVGYDHVVMVTMRGVVFGFGCNNKHQLGVVDPSAQSGGIVSMPGIEVFGAVTKFEGVGKLPDGK